MSLSSFQNKLVKEKAKYKSKSSLNSNSNSSEYNSNSDSSSFKSSNFNQNFFNEVNNDNKNNDSDSNNNEFNINTTTKYTSDLEQKETTPSSEKEKNEQNDYISNNSLYESKDILNIEEETNNNSFINFSILKFLFNNNSYKNNKSNNNSNIFKQIQTFIKEKFYKPLNNWIIKSSEIKRVRKIGEGSSSDIYLGMFRGTEIAEKQLHLINLKKNIASFKREVSSFIILQHPYLLMFYGLIAEPKQLSIITEYCSGGNLHDLLTKKKYIYLPWQLRKNFLLQIALGMNFLHKNNPPILHRDLKSLNVFLTNDIEKGADITDIKIADFGLSVFYEKNSNLTERVGTCHWMAPEVIKSQRYSTKADVYSYGIIIWEVCTREKPYNYMKRDDILYRVSVKKERPNINCLPKDTPKKFLELMIKCWDHDPDERPSFENIINYIQDMGL